MPVHYKSAVSPRNLFEWTYRFCQVHEVVVAIVVVAALVVKMARLLGSSNVAAG